MARGCGFWEGRGVQSGAGSLRDLSARHPCRQPHCFPCGPHWDRATNPEQDACPRIVSQRKVPGILPQGRLQGLLL